MDDVRILSESVIKLECIKEEPEDSMQVPVWQTPEVVEPSTFMCVVKDEDDEEEELKPPATVFLDPKYVGKVEAKEEYEDPLAMCSDTIVKKEENSCSTGGAEFPSLGALNESQTAAESAAEQSVCGCSRHFSSEGETSTAANTNPREKSLNCLKCKTSSAEEASNVPTRNDPTDTYICSVRQKTFKIEKRFIKLMRTHTGETLYRCSVCQKSYRYKTRLVSHMRTHTGERAYCCSDCPESFKDKKCFVSHMRTYSYAGTRETLHRCSECEETFKYKSSLLSHMRTHSGKYYHCSVCQESFRCQYKHYSRNKCHYI